MCNRACSYCLSKRWNKPLSHGVEHLLSADVIFKWLDTYCPPHKWMIEITGGGEPTCHPEIVKIIEGLTTRGYYFCIRSNGTHFIPSSPNLKRVVTWHYGNDIPRSCDSVIVLKNPAEEWRDKVLFCIDNRIPYEVKPLQNYCRDSCERPCEVVAHTNSLIMRVQVIFPNGVLVQCNGQSKRGLVDDTLTIQNMSPPNPRTPCPLCRPVRNFEALYSDKEKEFFRERLCAK